MELLRELRVFAIKEAEMFNQLIGELQHLNRTETPVPNRAVKGRSAIKAPSLPRLSEMLREHRVADYLNVSVRTLQNWRMFSKGPKFVKIGRAVRYKRADVETWLDSCPGL